MKHLKGRYRYYLNVPTLPVSTSRELPSGKRDQIEYIWAHPRRMAIQLRKDDIGVIRVDNSGCFAQTCTLVIEQLDA